MNTVVIHIGYPKTATTFLQDEVFGQLNNCLYIGKKDFNNNEFRIIQDFVLSGNEKSRDQSIEILRVLLSDIPLLLSDEDFIYNSLRFSSFKNNTPFKDSLIRLNSIINVFDCKIKFIITRRNVEDLVKSVYAQSFTNFFSTIKDLDNFEKFKQNFLFSDFESDSKKIFFHALNASNLESDIKEIFPEATVQIFNFEDFLDAPKLFMKKFIPEELMSKSNKELILNTEYQRKINSRKLDSKYLTNNGALYNILLRIRNSYFPNLKLNSRILTKFVRKIKFKSKKISISMNKEEIDKLRSAIYFIDL